MSCGQGSPRGRGQSIVLAEVVLQCPLQRPLRLLPYYKGKTVRRTKEARLLPAWLLPVHRRAPPCRLRCSRRLRRSHHPLGPLHHSSRSPRPALRLRRRPPAVTVSALTPTMMILSGKSTCVWKTASSAAHWPPWTHYTYKRHRRCFWSSYSYTACACACTWRACMPMQTLCLFYIIHRCPSRTHIYLLHATRRRLRSFLDR